MEGFQKRILSMKHVCKGKERIYAIERNSSMDGHLVNNNRQENCVQMRDARLGALHIGLTRRSISYKELWIHKTAIQGDERKTRPAGESYPGILRG